MAGSTSGITAFVDKEGFAGGFDILPIILVSQVTCIAERSSSLPMKWPCCASLTTGVEPHLRRSRQKEKNRDRGALAMSFVDDAAHLASS